MKRKETKEEKHVTHLEKSTKLVKLRKTDTKHTYNQSEHWSYHPK